MLAAAVCAGTAAWLSLGVLTVVDAGGQRTGALPPVWLLAVFVLVAVASVTVARVQARTGLLLFLSSLLLLPWLPVPVPDVFLTWTGPVTWLVWGAIGLRMLAAVACWIQPRGFALVRDARAAPLAAAGLAFVTFLAVRMGQGPPPTGDEPHYLVIAQSLVEDGDVKVGNNYKDGSYLGYYPGRLEPHVSPPGINGEVYSLHAPGLPALVALAFALGGYWAVVVWVAALSAIGSAFVWKAAHAVTRDVGAAWFGWAAVTLTAPLVLHGTLIYPDSVAGMLLCAGVLALAREAELARVSPGATRERDPHARLQPVWQWLGLGLAVGFLPWLHTRLALPAAALGLVLLMRIVRRMRSGAGRCTLAAFGTPIALSAGAWLAFFWIAYGTFNAAAPYGGRVPLSTANVASGLLGLIADQEFGLLPNAPIYLLSIGGLWSVFKLDRRLGLELLLIVAPYVIAASGYPMWWLGASTPARLLVPILFSIGVALAALWSRQDGPGRVASLTLLAASVLVAAALAFGGGGSLAYNGASGRARWLDWVSPLVNLPGGFPSFFRTPSAALPAGSGVGSELLRSTALWCVAVAAGWMAFRAISRRLPAARPATVLLAPSCLIAACVLGVGATWSTAARSHLLPTRAQLEFLRGDDLRLRPLFVQLFPPRVLTATDAPARLALTTSSLDAPPPGALLFLTEVPPGRYRIRVVQKPLSSGTMVLGLGRASVPLARWPLSAEAGSAPMLALPVAASFITVTGDEHAARSVETVALVPAGRVPRAGPVGARARDAARYGTVSVYALDDRIWLEPDGFWIMGGRRPDVIVTTDGPVPWIELDVRNVSTANRVHLSAGRWSAERALAPDERWSVRVPMAGLGLSVTMGFDVERGVRTADRMLGCRVEVR